MESTRTQVSLENYETGLTLEAQIVKDLDKFDMILRALKLELQHHHILESLSVLELKQSRNGHKKFKNSTIYLIIRTISLRGQNSYKMVYADDVVHLNDPYSRGVLIAYLVFECVLIGVCSYKLYWCFRVKLEDSLIQLKNCLMTILMIILSNR